MKQNLNEPIKNGTIRVIQRFALFPIKIGSVRIWMETVYIQQVFHEYIGDEYSGAWNVWFNEKFVSKEEYLLFVGKSLFPGNIIIHRKY